MIGMGLNPGLLFDVLIKYFYSRLVGCVDLLHKNKKKILEKH